MTCTNCKHKLKVVDTRSDGTITARKHQCPNCKLRVYTKETIDEEHETFNALKQYANIKSQMQGANRTQKYEQLKINI